MPKDLPLAPQLCKNIIDIEILKKAGGAVYNINLMRTLQLMNLELNMNNNKLGCDLMARGEKCKKRVHQPITCTAALSK
jgi:hypothetical protein